MKKIGINHYGDKNSIRIGDKHGFIRRFAVTSAHLHYSQMLPLLLVPENQDDYAWADSAYSGQCFEDLLSLGGVESRIHKKGSSNHPHSDEAKDRNSAKSAIRDCGEHIFGCMTTSMGSKLTRKIGIARNKAWWCLKNLTFNFLRYLPPLK